MFDIGWSELLVIAVIAIVVVGPRDLPRMMRNVGRYVGKAKSMAREFQSQFDDAVRDTEFEDVRKTIGDLTSTSPSNSIAGALSPFTDAADDLKNSLDKVDAAAVTAEPDAAKTKKKVTTKKATVKKQPAKKVPAKKAAKAPATKPAAKSVAPKAKKVSQRKPARKSAKSAT